ncbi:hypothetical protein HDU83_006372 [Entophlyctis luteolus]|nr:hypothetical protein HDU83_006372 [Entophlyctis luteolus]
MVLEEVTYPSADARVKLGGVMIMAPTNSRYAIDGKMPVVIMSHGFGETIDFGLMPFAVRFNQVLGAHVFMFDNRSFGMSEGTPRQVFHATNQVRDWLATIKFVKTLPLVDPARVVAWGDSLAGSHVINVATIVSQRRRGRSHRSNGEKKDDDGADSDASSSSNASSRENSGGEADKPTDGTVQSKVSKSTSFPSVHGDARIFAAIAQVPMTDGAGAFARQWSNNGVANNLRLVPAVAVDLLRSAVGSRAASYVALSSDSAARASILATDSIATKRVEQYENSARSAESADFSDFNRLAGRSIFSAALYNPVKNINKLRIPLLYQYAENDQLCPTDGTDKILARTDKRYVTAIRYPGDHYMPYEWNHDGQFKLVMRDQLAFLDTKLRQHLNAWAHGSDNVLWHASVPARLVAAAAPTSPTAMEFTDAVVADDRKYSVSTETWSFSDVATVGSLQASVASNDPRSVGTVNSSSSFEFQNVLEAAQGHARQLRIPQQNSGARLQRSFSLNSKSRPIDNHSENAQR